MGSLPAVNAPSIPLPAQLGGVEVQVNGITAPLLAVRPGQINLQVPSATVPGIATVQIKRDGSAIASFSAWIAAAAPGLFGAMPDASGSVIQIFANGQGATDPPVADGEAPAAPAQSRLAPRVYFGADLAEVLFSGLSPAFPGLWQINVRVPQSAGVSGVMPVFVAMGARASNAVAVPLGN
jgi:uncharacterized protein (TIGR03437 family)